MTWFLLSLFAGMCLFLVVWGMRKPGRIIEFPFLMGATFVGFILPQAVSLTYNEMLPSAMLDKALLMSFLCAGMCYLPGSRRKNHRRKPLLGSIISTTTSNPWRL